VLQADDDLEKGGYGEMKKIMPTMYLLIAIVAMAVVHFLVPVIQVISMPWIILGIIPIAGGVALNLIADGAFRRVKTTVKPFQESTTLVTSGTYRISRNPMYLGFALILLGIAIILGSLAPFVILLVFCILIDRVFIRVEERMLEDKFGQAWLEYKARVRRWV
jgi:protein-S-isoprenylcysteine O-methyltransferase Ste14